MIYNFCNYILESLFGWRINEDLHAKTFGLGESKVIRVRHALVQKKDTHKVVFSTRENGC